MSDGSVLKRDLYILEDENNPTGSKSDKIYPSTILDQVYDDTDPDNKNLREIIDDIREEIATGGGAEIPYPVRSVNGKQGDVNITKSDVGLSKVDNTSDNEKPLSQPQENRVMDILSNYPFQPDLAPLYRHMADHQNPHNVTFEQINSGGDVERKVAEGVTAHNINSSSHQDIRDRVTNLGATLSQYILAAQNQADLAVANLVDHCEDPAAHSELFGRKEDATKKVVSITEANTNYDNYPSTKAMVNHVQAAIEDYMNTHNLQGGIVDILVAEKKSDVPPAGITLLKVAYLVLIGDNGDMELGICRQTGNSYYWDYVSIGVYSEYDGTYFKYEVGKGLTLDMSAIASELVNDSTFVGDVGDALLNNQGFVDELEDTCKDMDLPIGQIPLNPTSTEGLSMWVETSE